jgi:hypothetical protein
MKDGLAVRDGYDRELRHRAIKGGHEREPSKSTTKKGRERDSLGRWPLMMAANNALTA